MNFSLPSAPFAAAWQLRAGQQLRMLIGDAESVVYNDRSGETHLLSAIAVSLLQYLQQSRAVSSPAITAHLAMTWEFDSDEDADEVTRKLLADLDALGLIETRPS